MLQTLGRAAAQGACKCLNRPTATGGTFDYEEETTAHYADAYNARLEEARIVADALHLPVELPAPFRPPEPA